MSRELELVLGKVRSSFLLRYYRITVFENCITPKIHPLEDSDWSFTG
jgi:hypothetical protein